MSRRVFVSSTKKDLTEHRSSVQEALRILGAHDISMENLGARDERPPEECARLVREDSDIFVGIYAHRYGCVPDGASVSICEMEYRAATEARLPRFIYLVDDDWPWPPKYIDQAPDDVRRMREFKSVLLKGHMCQSFGSEDDLAKKVVADVGRHLAMHAAKRVPSGHRDRIEPGAFSHIGVESIPVEAITPAMVNAAHPSNQRRNEIYRRNRGVFLTHVIRPSNKPGQSFDVYIYLLRHEGPRPDDLGDVERAEFFLGPYWDNQVFQVSHRQGFIGITTSAYGTFLCTCVVRFRDGYTVDLDRYIDFEALRTDGQGA